MVRSRWDFLLARLVKRGRVLQAGEYRFDHPASPVEVLGRIARGDIFYYELVVPEGQNMFDIAAAVEDLGLFKASRFLAAARNPALIRDLDPLAPTPRRLPLSRHLQAQPPHHAGGLCRLMTAKFRAEWGSLTRNAGRTQHGDAGLAGGEGKQTGRGAPQIAAVFENRLRIGMKLDCDSTTIYAALLDGRYRGVIHRSDLDSDHPYNTYRHAGLPPGPIANPSLASIRAVRRPRAYRRSLFRAAARRLGRARVLQQHRGARSRRRQVPPCRKSKK